jgi:hypothetical protein
MTTTEPIADLIDAAVSGRAELIEKLTARQEWAEAQINKLIGAIERQAQLIDRYEELLRLREDRVTDAHAGLLQAAIEHRAAGRTEVADAYEHAIRIVTEHTGVCVY